MVNSAEMSTADFVRHRDANLKVDARLAAIGNVVGDENLSTLDANSAAEKILGNSIFANVLLLGCAWQQGLVPVSLIAIKRAIELNGVEVGHAFVFVEPFEVPVMRVAFASLLHRQDV